MLKTFTILYDTREKNTELLRQRIASFGCPAERKKLDFGDYTAKVTLPSGNEFSLENFVVIERKQDIDELCACFSSNRSRFVQEFERAADLTAKTYLLVENTTWKDIYNGKYANSMNTKALIGNITTWLARYNCSLLFCEPYITGKLIHDVLLHEMRETLYYIEYDITPNFPLSLGNPIYQKEEEEVIVW